jgi:hypothetical protein
MRVSASLEKEAMSRHALPLTSCGARTALDLRAVLYCTYMEWEREKLYVLSTMVH